MKVSVITLGCDKNTVDSERYLAELVAHGSERAATPEDADLILVNTCGFIDAAKRESIDAIVQAGSLKSAGRCRAVVAVGCMVERHKMELEEALPEVDLFLGTSETDRLVRVLGERGLLGPGDALAAHPGVRLYDGAIPHVRYLKISEGCDHGCAFCAIPLMRGRHRSFALADVVAEAQLLEAQGARELNLVAQDLAHYGRDRRAEGLSLPDLLASLIRETSVPWIRMLYLYSAGITPRLLDLVAREPRIVPYLDMPIQHGSDPVLARMRRPERAHTIREAVARARSIIPDLAVRTTCIVGFPGETDGDFQALLELLEDVRFDRVGGFTYSAQAGTRAAELDDDVPESTKLARLEALEDLQRSITAERYESRLGRNWHALVDEPARDGGAAVARLPWQADDVDGVTFLDADLPAGALVEVVPHDIVDDYDFVARVVRVIDAPPGRPSRVRGGRSLPVVGSSSTAGSFGR